MSLSRWPLRLKVLLLVILSAIIVISCFGYIEYRAAANRLNDTVNNLGNTIIERLTANLQETVWSYNLEATRDMVYSEMRDKSVEAILVWQRDIQDIPFIGVKRRGNALINIIKSPERENFFFEKKIIRNDIFIGTIELYLTDVSLRKQLNDSIKRNAAELLIGSVILIGILIIVLNKFFIAPLLLLKYAITQVQKGNFEQHIVINSKDELGTIARSFNKMVNVLGNHRYHLEELVKARTFELTQANEQLTREIAEREQAQEALRESEEKHRMLFDNAGAAITYFDMDCRIVLANEYAARDFGLSRAAMIGKSPEELLPPEEAEVTRKRLDSIMKSGTPAVYESKVVFFNNEKWFLLNIQPVKEFDGETIGVQVIASDISELKKAREELEAAHKELIETAHKAGMADVATGVLHNVGNILNSVMTSGNVIRETVEMSIYNDFSKAIELLKGNLDRIDSFITEDPRGKKLLEYFIELEKLFGKENKTVIEHAKRLYEKVDTIRDVIIAQQEYASGITFAEEFSLHKIVEDAIQMQETALTRYGLKIIKDFEDAPQIVLQKAKVLNIIINLLKNARESIINSQPKEKLITTSITKEEGAVIFKITDTGEGIKKEDLHKIFTHGYTTKAYGHGFGLHSCANYMAEQGGAMWAESEGEGKGATFVLKFPVLGRIRSD